MMPIRRTAARVALLDDLDRVLLMESTDPLERGDRRWWELPGGGVHRGESTAAAALRELREETGLTEVEVGPCVWTRRVEFTFSGMRFDQDEWIHIARLRGEATVDTAHESLEALAFLGPRWWTPDEISASGATFHPSRLGELLVPILAGEVPGEPLEIGT